MMASSSQSNQAAPKNANMSHIIPPDKPPKLHQASQTSNSPNFQATAEVTTAQVVHDSQNIGQNDSTGVSKRPPSSSPKPSSPFIPPLIPDNPSKKIRQNIPDKLRITNLGPKRSVLPDSILRETDCIQQIDRQSMSPFQWKSSNQYSAEFGVIKRMELPVCSEEEQLHEEEQKSNEEKFRETENIKAYVADGWEIAHQRSSPGLYTFPD